nr:relaxase/mobilization nuclease domain-containing protein [Massilistercora timonensis]
MATTSLWHIEGRLKDLIAYVENPEKTKADNPNLQPLWDVFSYVSRPEATEQGEYVSSINCLKEIALQQMILTKKQYGKENGYIAWHGYQSFKPDEVTPEQAHQIGLQLAKEMWGDRFQIIVTTHLDKDHLHNHFCFNSVSFLDGKKYNRRIFEDTHPAIVDRHIFETVQEIRKHKRRPTATGKLSIFSGKVFCADCGAKLHYCTANAFKANQDFFVCANYRSNTGTCTGHYIRAVTLNRLVFRHIQSVLSYIQQFEASFVKKEMEKANAERKLSIEKAKVDIVTLKRRDEDLDTLFKRIYEDMVSGRLSAERFDKLSSEYETEQKDVKAAILDLQDLIDSGEQEQHDLQQFLKNVRKYTDPQELTAEILNDLVDKIVVHAPDKSSGHRKQKIEIYYKAAGIINIADEDCVALDGRLGMQNRKKKTA